MLCYFVATALRIPMSLVLAAPVAGQEIGLGSQKVLGKEETLNFKAKFCKQRNLSDRHDSNYHCWV